MPIIASKIQIEVSFLSSVHYTASRKQVAKGIEEAAVLLFFHLLDVIHQHFKISMFVAPSGFHEI